VPAGISGCQVWSVSDTLVPPAAFISCDFASRQGAGARRVFHARSYVGYNAVVKLQFSLATLLVCITVLAVVCAACVQVSVQDWEFRRISDHRAVLYPSAEVDQDGKKAFDRPPQVDEIARRLALWGPASIAATLGVLWIEPRLQWSQLTA